MNIYHNANSKLHGALSDLLKVLLSNLKLNLSAPSNEAIRTAAIKFILNKLNAFTILRT